MRRVIAAGLGFVLAGALTACAPRQDAGENEPSTDTLAADQPPSSDGVQPAATDSVPGELVGTTWRLTELGAGEPVPAGVEITAEFRQGGIGGRSGCNHYTGPVAIDLAAGTIEVGALVSTEMACPPSRMEAEMRYLGSLERAAGIALEPDRLTIRSDREGAEPSSLVFVPMTGP